MNEHEIGLCATCVWMKIVENKRGSVFYRCKRADADPHFVRYPPLPVLRCPGYERRTGDAAADGGGRSL